MANDQDPSDESGARPDLTDEDVVRRVLAEEGLDAVRVLAVLAGTLAWRHVDCTLRRMGRRPPRPPGNDRANSLTAAMDALHEYRSLNEKARDEHAGPGREDDESVSDEDFVDGLVAGDLANLQRVAMRILADCQFLAEREAGLDEDDDEDDGGERPWMRLVRD
jgi:hypothetical protein